MDILEFLFVPIILVLVVVLPCWIIFHSVTRWRTAKVLSADDEKILSELWENAAKMESRINSLERILDAEAPEWRSKV